MTPERIIDHAYPGSMVNFKNTKGQQSIGFVEMPICRKTAQKMAATRDSGSSIFVRTTNSKGNDIGVWIAAHHILTITHGPKSTAPGNVKAFHKGEPIK